MNRKIRTAETVAIFAILFILIGTFVPIAYVEVAPESHFIEVHNFSAEDTHAQADEHYVYLNRTVHKPADAEVVVEMQLQKGDGTIIEEDSFSIDAYYQQGQREIIIPRQIRHDGSLEPGTYRYIDSVTLTYNNGLSERTFVYTSDEFTVYENETILERNN